MSTHKNINRICLIGALLSLLLTLVFVNGRALGIQPADRVLGYENRLFDTSKVHTVDIVMDDWEGFIETCQSEEYSSCAVVIDGEAYKNVAIRGKGNTSLSTVASMGSDRYSFKIEFDHYDNTKTYHGLDKLCLNNLIQDSTMMKDYLAYTLMGEFGAAAPMCSYVYVTVNGEDWGLYLAVEAIEESFLQRNYGSDYGNLYKPDSMSFGGGRGNGRDFDMDDFMDRFNAGNREAQNDSAQQAAPKPPEGGGTPDMGGFPGGGRDGMGRGEHENPGGTMDGSRPGGSTAPGGFQFGEQDGTSPEGFDSGNTFGGMGSSDVKLQYIDNDPESYTSIFGSAKTDVSDADQVRLIASLKSLSSYEDLENVLDTDAVLRYFVVHDFLVNGDSYTGSMIHNYYLYEQDGRLSMLPWDYNLAFGTFSGDASGAVNDPIDDQLTDRPMQGWIFSNEEYTRQYHQLYSEFLSAIDLDSLIDGTAALIAPYVEKDPTAFYSYEEFQTGVEALKTFCTLRVRSIQGQLEGTVPSTSAAQRADSDALIAADGLVLADMGSMGGGAFGGGPDGDPGFHGGNFSGAPGDIGSGDDASSGNLPQRNFQIPGGAQGGDMPTFGNGEQPSASQEDGRQPTVPQMNGMPTAPMGNGTDFSGGDSKSFPAQSGTVGGTASWSLVGASAAVLLGAVLVALLYRRRGR